MRTDAFRRPGRRGRTARPAPDSAVHLAVVPADARRGDEDAVALPVPSGLPRLAGAGTQCGGASGILTVPALRRPVGPPAPEKAEPLRTTVTGGGSPRRIAA
ncbi:hypothetical protein [Streptomyces sp. NPDC051310]|uniref:hypothetical protein n=1 Tax=Streptomyces sp. NPDC051310 TaxID=3365649 RepID=UPI0037B1D4F6